MFVSVCAATGRAIVCGSSCFVITIGEIRKRLDPELFFLSLWRNDTHSENHWKNMSHLISMPVWHGLPSRLPLWRQLLQSESCKFHSFFWVFCVRPVSSFDLGAIHSQKCTKSRTNHRESNRHFPAVRFVLLAASLSVCPGNGAWTRTVAPSTCPTTPSQFPQFWIHNLWNTFSLSRRPDLHERRLSMPTNMCQSQSSKFFFCNTHYAIIINKV